MDRWRLTLLFAAIIVAHGAAAGVIRHDVPDQLYLDLAAESAYDPVGRFTWSEPAGSFLGSGVLISDEWVLTAAHVIDGTDGLGGGISNLNFLVDGSTRSAAEWIPHPEWAATGGEDNLFAGWDIGLVRLSTAVTTIDPAALYLGENELGQVGTMVGYGATGTGLTGSTGPSGTKRAGQNAIDAVGRSRTPGSLLAPRSDRLISVDFDSPDDPGVSTLGESTPLDLEYLTAPGDSGGGLFIEEDGEVLLAGVTSLGSGLDGADSDYGDRASFTRVSRFIDWIEATTSLPLSSPPLVGDYNGDGRVDPNDLLVWESEYGAAGDELVADGNGDSVVDGADYTVWRDNLTEPIDNFGVATVIPEPSSAAALVVVAALLATAIRRA